MDRTIAILDQHQMDPSVNTEERDSYYVRRAARAVLSDQNGRIALIHAGRRDYYKIPGGGIEEGEDLHVALAREVLEETGSRVTVTGELGQVLEWRDSHKLKQVSYAFRALLLGDSGAPDYTESEIDECFEVRWIDNLDEAIRLVDSGNAHEDIGVVFMTKRDAAILRAAR